jgi:60 kDa SS-A/Ro ribonucleoprotein
MTNASKLASIGGGGTNVSAPLAMLADGRKVDLCILVSDNQSWIDKSHARASQTMLMWELVKARNPEAKLVCIDVQPYGHTQAQDRDDILNVGGFSDAVFEVVASFAKGDGAHWIEVIQRVEL